MSEENEDFITNDLSFLEDIDVDSIVEYLNETDNAFYTKRKEYDGSTSMPQDSSKIKKIKINTSKSQKESKQIVQNDDFVIDTQIKKINITIKTISKDCDSNSTSTIENGLQKGKEKEEIFLNLAVTHDCESIIDNRDNNNFTKIVERVSEKNDKNSQETQLFRSINDDNVKNDIKISMIEEIESTNVSPLLPEAENNKDNLENMPENTQDTSSKDSKINNIVSKKELTTLSKDSNKNYESNNEKRSNLEENKIYVPKTNNLLPVKSKVVRRNESKIDSDSNNLTHLEFLNGNKLDDSKMTKLSSAISVVVRKDDLCLADRLQNRLYQFLKVKFSDLNVFHYGRYSKIFKCQQNGKKYALKLINPDLDTRLFGTEKGKMLNKLQHNILRDELYFIYLFASFGLEMSWCFLFDFYPTNLREELKTHGPMHISTVTNLSRQLITALNRLRSQHIIHSDIKPEHILLNESTSVLKLCGFDRAYHIDEEAILPNIGTPSYRAPEVILGYSASFSIDMWSTGLVIYEMMTDVKLFRGCFNNDILFKQMCVLGNMPLDMVTNSIYGTNHFVKRKFLKKEGHNGKDIRIIYNFFKNNSYKREPYRLYNKYWRCVTTLVLQEEDIKMISKLVGIVDKMLVLHPDDRIPIEVLYDDPFMLKACY